MLALHVAFLNHFQFGRDVVFTFGPWGFLNTRAYFPQTFGLTLAAWAFFALIFWRTAWLIAKEHIANPALALIWLIALCGIAGMNLFSQSATLLSLISLLAVFYFYCDSRKFPLTMSLLIAAVALSSLIKFTYFIAAILTILPIAIDQIRQRRWPIGLFAFASFFLAFYLLAGQKLGFLGEYLRLSSQVAGGYTDAMSFSTGAQRIGPFLNAPPIDLMLFLLNSVLLIGAVLAAQWKRSDWLGFVLVPAAIGGLIFTFAKWGYVRHDLVHAPLAALAMLFLSLLCLPALRTRLPGRRWRVRLGLVASSAVIASWTLIRAGTGQSLPSYFACSMLFELRGDVLAAAATLGGRSNNAADYASALGEIRGFTPLPPVHGTVDVYPWNQAIAAAYDLPYHPRPVFQSYSAYSPQLAGLNAAYIQSTRAPDSILFAVTHDMCGLQHFPALDDGFSWPQLLCRYDISGSRGDFLILTKALRPRSFEFVPLATVVTKLGEPISIPSGAGGLIWAKIQVDSTKPGKLLSLLYKSPELWMTATTRDGNQQTYRFVAGSAAAGFLLSPIVLDNRAFKAIASETNSDLLDRQGVKTVTLDERGWIGQEWAYRPQIKVKFYRLELRSANAVTARMDDAPITK